MEQEFYDYLKKMYWNNIQYDVQKSICVHKSAYTSDDEICFWDFDNRLNVSDPTDYVVEYQRIYKFNKKYSTEYELPNLLYQTSDIMKIESLLEALEIGNYEEKVKQLMNAVSREKTLSLVDNEGYVKYN